MAHCGSKGPHELQPASPLAGSSALTMADLRVFKFKILKHLRTVRHCYPFPRLDSCVHLWR